jgi:2-methylisocitrate lyase-like PEP mutase family enzyme
MTLVARKAAALRRLHAGPAILVLVNVWDVASARTVAALPGCRAIATGSWPIAASLGVPDGEVLTRDQMLAVAGRIAAAVDLPVTADLEAGYGDTPAEVAETVRHAIAGGIAGCNLEDGERPLAEAVARVAAACRSANADSAGFVVNARLDMSVRDGRELGAAVARARAFLDAGAACVYPIALADPSLIGEFVQRLGGPVNVYGRPGGPSVRQLEALGVARVSFGPGPQGAALAALQRIGADLLAGGDVDQSLAFRPPV